MDIFRYDKNNSLIEYVCLNHTGGTEINILLKDNLFIKKIRENEEEKDDYYFEASIFSESAKLIADSLSPGWIRVVNNEYKNNDKKLLLLKPKREFGISFTSEEFISFTVSNDLIENWANKLNGK